MLAYEAGESRVGTGFGVAGCRTQRWQWLLCRPPPDPSSAPAVGLATRSWGRLGLVFVFVSHLILSLSLSFFFYFCFFNIKNIYVVGLQRFWSLSFTPGAFFLRLRGAATPGNLTLLKFARSPARGVPGASACGTFSAVIASLIVVAVLGR